MSDSDEEDFTYFGTPLEELDEDEVRTRKAPRIEDQFARDKQGRRRFHGAFTGGFSAGYFNSVGTKEGWTPSTFVSSRSQRTSSTQAKPQDFMDEEDMAVHGISPQGIQASSSFDDSDQKKRKRVLDPSGPIPGTPVLEEILKPSRETVGMKILRHLGWRPGQGVGPRISRYQKEAARRERKKIYGPQKLQDSNSDSEDDGEAYLQDVTFAPDDVDTLSLTQAKVDQFGLGYKPLDRTPVLGGHINLFDPSPLAMTEKKKKVLIKGQAFGVGAFEDDDEDIYATEDMSNYDFGEEKKASNKGGGDHKNQPDMVSLGLIEVLEGFRISSKSQDHLKVYPQPVIPQDFLPHHQPRRRRFERKESEIRGLERHNMTAEQRAKSIAEQPRTTVEVRSGVKGEVQQPSKDDKSKSIDPSAVDKIYEEFKSSQTKLSSDFKPFAKDIEKQRRYELYLRMREKGQKGKLIVQSFMEKLPFVIFAGLPVPEIIILLNVAPTGYFTLGDRFYLAQPKSMTEWEREREMQEFSKAALLFQPLTSSMANRFVSAVTTDSNPNLKDGLNVNIPKVDPTTNDSNIDALGSNVADERMKAAKMNMFGKLTQSAVDWHPDRLLCRRFNVPNPYPESSHVGVYETKREKFSIFNLLTAPVEDTAGLQQASSVPEEKEGKTDDENVDDKPEPENFGLKISVNGPPTMDLFKAIFQDSDSDSSSESESEESTRDITKEEELLDKDLHPKKLNSSDTVTSISSVVKNSSGSQMDSDNKNFAVIATIDDMKDSRSVKDTTEDPTAKHRPDQQRVRISRFEPKEESSTCRYEGLPKPVFIQRKKDTVASEVAPSKGIFANIDFEALNSYRKTNVNASPDQTNTTDKGEESTCKSGQIDSDSSVDSENEYGPPVPTHLKNRFQMIRSPPPAKTAIMQNIQEKQDTLCKQDTEWVEKGPKSKSSMKHKHKDKNKFKKKKKKKDKKNKKHKERKHKKKEFKSLSRKNSSSSTIELSDSD